MHRASRLTWLLLWILIGSGCARLPRGGMDHIDPGDITLDVENRNFADATIYAVSGDVRVRVGRVSGKTNQTLTFRWQRETLQMLVRFTGGGRVLSQRRPLVPGAEDTLLLIIGVSPNSPAMLTVRR